MRAMRQGREWALARVARGALRAVIWRPDPRRPARTIRHVRPPREDKKDSLTMINSTLFLLLLLAGSYCPRTSFRGFWTKRYRRKNNWTWISRRPCVNGYLNGTWGARERQWGKSGRD